MKKFVNQSAIIFLITIFSFSVLLGLGYAESSKDLYALAKKGGTVHFGGSSAVKMMNSLIKTFEAKYPGVKVKYTRKSSATLTSLIETERKANRITFDLIKIGQPIDVLMLKDKGYWAKYKHENWDKIPDKFKDKDGYFVTNSVGAMPGAYNPKVISAAEAPKSYKDVLDPKWKNKMSNSSPSRAISGLVATARVVELYGWEYIKKLSDLGAMYVGGHGSVTRMVISGERPLAWEITSYRSIKEEVGGSPLKAIWFTEGVPVYVTYLGIPEKAPHPAGARLLANFLMSREGQQIQTKTSYYWSVLPNMEPPPHLKPLEQTNLWYPDMDYILKNGKEIAKKFDSIFGIK